MKLIEPYTTTHDSIPAETGKNDGDRTSGDCISRTQAIDKFIDGLEEIFADLRERHVDDSVCGLCEYDGAYMGQSGDWCNECPGFDRDDCFKLSDKTRKRWTDEIIKALPSIQPEQRWIPVAEALPEEYGEYLVTYKSDGDQMFMDIVEYEPSFEFDHEKNRFKGNWLFADDCRSVDPEVLAWMPLPEIYQEGGE